MDRLIQEHGAAVIQLLWVALGFMGAAFLALAGFVWMVVRLWFGREKKTLDAQFSAMADTDRELGKKMEQLKDQDLMTFKDKTSQQFSMIHDYQMSNAAENKLEHSEIRGSINEFKMEMAGRLQSLEAKMPNGELKQMANQLERISKALDLRED
jgi:hypothetical protein